MKRRSRHEPAAARKTESGGKLGSCPSVWKQKRPPLIHEYFNPRAVMPVMAVAVARRIRVVAPLVRVAVTAGVVSVVMPVAVSPVRIVMPVPGRVVMAASMMTAVSRGVVPAVAAMAVVARESGRAESEGNGEEGESEELFHGGRWKFDHGRRASIQGFALHFLLKSYWGRRWPLSSLPNQGTLPEPLLCL